MYIFRLIAALTFSLSLSGCLVTAVVGTTTGVAKIANDERTLGRQFDDVATASKIDARLIAERDMPSRWISIDVVNGNATLTGSLPSQSQIDRAIFISKSIQGVRSVDSKLSVGTPKLVTLLSDTWITTQVKRNLLNDKVVSGLGIHVETVNGKVYLQGVVNNAAERVRAKELTHKVKGVTAIVDLMQKTTS
ncbi:MAG: BON domain-containing protein [Mariprofundus sp.]